MTTAKRPASIIEKLARGGMAEIFLARRDQETVVVKRPHDQAEASECFWHEAIVTQAVKHQNVVDYLGYEQMDGRPSMILEYVDGPDLFTFANSLHQAKRKVGWSLAAHIVAEAAAGLQAAHTARIGNVPLELVHCDVSMCNIVISSSGEVKVADFGAARSVMLSDQPGTVTGKLGYMAPERRGGGAFDHRADVYSLGVVLWELLAGRRLKSTGGRAPSVREVVPKVDPRLSTITGRALSASPNDRHESAQALCDDLRFWIGSRRDGMGSGVLGETVQRLCKKRRVFDHEPTRLMSTRRVAA